MKLFTFDRRKRSNSSIVKAGRYEDLPPYVQRAIDRTEVRVKGQSIKKHNIQSSNERLKNIILGKEQ